jgi:predicted nucleic acid-binding Zn ribbon protein
MTRIYDDDSRDEDPDENDGPEGGFDEDTDVLPCPYCGQEISEMAEVCPKCKSYVSREDAPRPRKSIGFILIVAVLILTLIGIGVIIR